MNGGHLNRTGNASPIAAVDVHGSELMALRLGSRYGSCRYVRYDERGDDCGGDYEIDGQTMLRP